MVRGMDVRRLADRLWLATRVGAWLCVLPLRWRAYGLTSVLERIGPAGRPRPESSSEIDSTIRVVRRVAALRLFRLPIFPRTCLREALALYHVLSHAGQPVEFCVGVRKCEGDLLAHSWVSLHGTPIVPADRECGFKLLYAYPDARGAGTLHGQSRRTSPIQERR
jgi:Transglutaminase-like superfamily